MRVRNPNRHRTALTRREVLVLVAVLGLFSLISLPVIHKQRERAKRIQCVSNLERIGITIRGLVIDLGGFPATVPATNGGAMDAKFAYQHFQILSNELKSPVVLKCPADTERNPPTGYAPGRISDQNISYFVGLDAADTKPNQFLAGDRNLTIDGTNVATGLATIGAQNQLGWNAKMHNNQGNILLSDGSVQSFSAATFGKAGISTNRLLFP